MPCVILVHLVVVDLQSSTSSKLLLQADQQTGDALLLLRNQVNLVLEQARNQKLLGSALEAKVLLHVADQNKADSLKSLNAAANGADPLRYAFITSQAQLVDSQVLCCLCFAVLCCAALHCALLCCAVLRYTVLFGACIDENDPPACAVLCCAVLGCAVLIPHRCCATHAV